MPDAIRLKINGVKVEVERGTMVAAAVVKAGAFRRSVTGEARAPVCGLGTCFECRVRIDGRGQCRSCQTVCEEGMEVITDA